MTDPVVVEYGRSFEAAHQNARPVAQKEGHIIVADEEVAHVTPC
jgi:hypothetical protein